MPRRWEPGTVSRTVDQTPGRQAPSDVCLLWRLTHSQLSRAASPGTQAGWCSHPQWLLGRARCGARWQGSPVSPYTGPGQPGVLAGRPCCPHRGSLCSLSIWEVQDTATGEVEGLDALKGVRRAFYHLRLGGRPLHLTAKPSEVRNPPATNLSYSPKAPRAL